MGDSPDYDAYWILCLLMNKIWHFIVYQWWYLVNDLDFSPPNEVPRILDMDLFIRDFLQREVDEGRLNYVRKRNGLSEVKRWELRVGPAYKTMEQGRRQKP